MPTLTCKQILQVKTTSNVWIAIGGPYSQKHFPLYVSCPLYMHNGEGGILVTTQLVMPFAL